jgi:hypothetical protein
MQRKWHASVSRPGHPHDNALKTLKREEIYANDYRDILI